MSWKPSVERGVAERRGGFDGIGDGSFPGPGDVDGVADFGIGWLRAAVLGANDGIVSTARLIVVWPRRSPVAAAFLLRALRAC